MNNSKILPGELGMTLVEYTGKAKTVKEWPSKLTGLVYKFGGEKTVSFVDDRDLDVLTDKLFKSADQHPQNNELVQVEWVRHVGKVALCQIDLRRYLVPGEYWGNRVPQWVLECAIEYGEDWTQVFSSVQFDAEHFQTALREAGIWTVDDFNDRRKSLLIALDKCLTLSICIRRPKDGRSNF